MSSTRILRKGYDSDKEILEVHFKHGPVYWYKGVPGSFYTECLLADSIGKYFFENIAESFPKEQVA